MKKTALIILALVLTLSLSLVVFAGCNKDDGKDENKAQVASNSETLGTAVAVAAAYSGAGGEAAASAASEEDGTLDVKAGINLEIEGFGATASIGADAAIVGLENLLEPVVKDGVNSVSCFVNENGVTVAEVTSDDEDFSNQYKVTVSYVDDETGEPATKEYSLYVNVADGVDVDGKTSYDFTAKFVLDENVSFSLSGSATYKADKDAMVFAFDLNLGGLASVEIEAQATADGNILVELGADALGVVGANVTIEIGKLDSGKYGAEITVNANLTVPVTGYEVVATAKVAVVGENKDSKYSFTLSGNLNVNVDLGDLLGEYEANGNIIGQAAYDATEDDLVIGIEGTLAFTKVAEENAAA